MSKIIIFERIKFFGGIGVHFPRTGGGGFFGRGVEMIFLEGWIVWGGKGFIFLEEKGEKIGGKGKKKSGGVESLFIMGMHKHFFGLGQG